MTAEAQSAPRSKGTQPKRRLRNFLLDPGFQLKYTGMVVGVTVLVTGAVGYWLGSEAYAYSQENSELLMTHAAGVSPELFEFLQEEAEAKDAEVLNSIILGISALVVTLALALGFTGIIVTHKVVGPAYKLKLLLGKIEEGNFAVRGGLRKGDELQDVGEAFKRMVSSLRERREEELAQLDEAIEAARSSETDEEVLRKLDALRERLEATLRG
ncbi:MAG TPA: hypothetical protein RMH99_26230 [Sandaracinaceae bacterium LLY-WYZ-13_1]|nr:hypothetical protein [Sandaracinaceae bacterium LLY-WYZ-13_1]